MAGETVVCLNPASAAGRTGRHEREIVARIEEALGPVRCERTRGPGDGARIAREARAAGAARIVVAGGDGTLNEVATGLLAHGATRPLGDGATHRVGDGTTGPIGEGAMRLPRDRAAGLVGEGGSDPPAEAVGRLPALGLLPLGSGWDLARSLGLPRDLDRALEVVSRGCTRRIDAGRAIVCAADGAPRERVFVNEASAGLSGDTIRIVGLLAKRLGARLGFALGAVGAILGHRALEAAIEIDGARVYEGPVSLVVAANGRCFGAGMQVAPRARVDDGRLEIVLVRGLSVPSLLVNLPSLFAGTHGAHPAVSFHAGRTLSVEPKGDAMYADLDGEAVGTLPLRAEILPGALEVFAEEAAS